MQIKIAARKSDLARLQAYRVGEALMKQHSHVEVLYQFSSSLGDQNQSSPLWQMPEKGVFTSDLTERLVKGECDLVVHSWKDLPIEEREETVIGATLPRADSRDLILFRHDFCEHPPKQLNILSSSPRRILNISEFLQWALPFKVTTEFHVVRGNIATRVQKLLAGEGEVHALVVAKAAFDRLLSSHEPEFENTRQVLRNALELCRWMVVPHTVNPCAPAQGALAIEVLRGRKDMLNLLQKINCPITYASAEHERSWLKKYGGGCHQKIGISSLSFSYGDIHIQKGEIEGRGTAPVSIHELKFVPKEKPTLTTAEFNKIFPVKMSDSIFFKRQSRNVNLSILNHRNLWVVKDHAWPANYKPTAGQVVWSSGLTTWRKLATQGVWVNGSQEGFGENESSMADIDALLGQKPHFLKLSHNEAVALSNNELCVTYDLCDIAQLPDLRGKTHFFWASYSSFRRALARYPEILTAQHSCGPGHTYRLIDQHLRKATNGYMKSRVTIFLTHQDWLRHFGEV